MAMTIMDFLRIQLTVDRFRPIGLLANRNQTDNLNKLILDAGKKQEFLKNFGVKDSNQLNIESTIVSLSNEALDKYASYLQNGISGADETKISDESSKSEAINAYKKNSVPRGYSKENPRTYQEGYSAFELARSANHSAIEKETSSTITAVNNSKYNNGMRNLSTETPNSWYLYSDEFKISHKMENLDEDAFNRQMVNKQMSNLFKEKDITIENGEDFNIEIDEYDYHVKVTGKDKDKAAEIESALNENDNGKNLYSHLYLCAMDVNMYENGSNNSNVDKEGQLKRYVNDFVKGRTGIDLRNAKATESGDFITEKGESVLEKLNEYSDKYALDEMKEAEKSLNAHYLNQVKDLDFSESGSTQTMKATLRKDGLHDVGQSVDYSNSSQLNRIAQKINSDSSTPVLSAFVLSNDAPTEDN